VYGLPSGKPQKTVYHSRTYYSLNA